MNYTFSETTPTNDAVVTVVIANFDEIEIQEEVTAGVAATGPGNATLVSGVCLRERERERKRETGGEEDQSG